MNSRTPRSAAFLLFASAILWLSGCGSSSPNQIVDTVTPASTTVLAGQVTSFASTVTGSDTTTSKWSCTFTYTPAPTSTTPSPQPTQPAACTSGQTVNGGSIGTWTTTDTTSPNVLTYTAPPLSKFPNPIPIITFIGTADADHKKTGKAAVGLDSGIRVTVTPSAATVPVGVNPAQTEKFTASLLNSPPTNLVWLVTQPNSSSTTVTNQTANPQSVTCSPSCGSIDTNGIFTAPATLPTDTNPAGSKSTNPTTVFVVVNSSSDPSEFAVATITLVDASTNPATFTRVSPDVIPAGGIVQDLILDAKNLLNTSTITFTPPGGTPQIIDSSNIFTIPGSKAYCTPSASGVTPVVTCDASITTRIRLNQSLLATPGTGFVTVNGLPDPNHSGQTTNISLPVTLTLASPALVAAAPDSFPEGTSTSGATMAINGGFYGSCSNLIVKLLFNGSLNSANCSGTSAGPRQFIGALSGNGGALSNPPGLYPVSIQSTGAPAPKFPTVTTNVAIQPAFTALANTFFPSPAQPIPSPVPACGASGYPTFLPPCVPLAAGATPSAIALDSTKAFAVVTEQATNSIQIINLAGGTPAPGSPIPVGTAPTGIAIDDQIDLTAFGFAPHTQDLGVVVNNGSNSLSLLALPAGTSLGTVNLAGLVTQQSGTTAPAPFSVGVDSGTHRAVVALSNSSIGFIVDVNPNSYSRSCFSSNGSSTTQNTPCAIATVSLKTGGTPQVVMQPQAPLAYVTPGANGTGNAGLLSAINLLLNDTVVDIASSSNSPAGAACSNGVATITTTSPHNINGTLGGAVIIAGVADNNFNGTFNVQSVSNPFTFTYALTCTSNGESSGGGTVEYGSPYYTFAVTPNVTGGAINPVTRTLALADPNASSAQVAFIQTLDQTLSSLTLNVGNCFNGCTPPAKTIGETGVNSVSFDPFTNVLVAFAPSANPAPTGTTSTTLSGNLISLINPGGPAAGGSQSPYRIIAGIPTGQVGTGSYTPSGSTTAVTVNGPMVYDPKTKLVLVANAGSNTLTYLGLDPSNTFKNVHVQSIQVTSGGVPSAQPALGSPIPAGCNPSGYSGPFVTNAVMIGCSSSSIRIFGEGFSQSTPSVRLDGDSTAITTTLVSDGEVDATVSGSRFSIPHDFALDVAVGALTSNTADLHAIGVVDMTPVCDAKSKAGSSSALQGQGPEAVAFDEIRHIALVTNYSCSSVSIINLDETGTLYNGAPYGSVLGTVTVGSQPIGIDVIPRLGIAVTANNGGNGTTGTASIINISNPQAPVESTGDVSVGVSPLGVAIDRDRGLALVANSGSNTVSAVDLPAILFPTSGTVSADTVLTIAVSGPPTAIAVDPNRAEAVVTNIQNSNTGSATGGLDVINLSTLTRSTTSSIGSITANPTGIVYDPAVSPALFYATSTQQNAVYSFNPDNLQTQLIRVGINPYSIAYNYQTGTMLTINSTSNTISVIDTQNFKTRETLALSSRSQFAAAMDVFNNTAVIVDQNNNRVLTIAMPK